MYVEGRGVGGETDMRRKREGEGRGNWTVRRVIRNENRRGWRDGKQTMCVLMFCLLISSLLKTLGLRPFFANHKLHGKDEVHSCHKGGIFLN